MNLTQRDVFLTGIARDIDVRENKTKEGKEYISLNVNIDTNGKAKDENHVENTIRVEFFAMKHNSKGAISKLYETYKNLSEEVNTVKNNPDSPDMLRIGMGELQENYWNKRSTPRVAATFCNIANDRQPENKFEVEGFISNIRPEMDKEGIETGRAIVTLCMVGGYENSENPQNSRYDLNVLDFVTEPNNDVAAEYILSNYQKNDFVKLAGKFVRELKREVVETPSAFGKPIENIKNTLVSELRIESGTQPVTNPLSDAEIETLAAERKARHLEIDNRATETASAPKQAEKPKSGGWSI